jgi:hypothetical protein
MESQGKNEKWRRFDPFWTCMNELESKITPKILLDCKENSPQNYENQPTDFKSVDIAVKKLVL